jgi:endonuclease/exonuclease/phosphatase family metal-dependent hydrolase
MLKEGQDEVGSKTGTGQQGGKMEKARAEQAKYLTTTIERFNADLAAPVILCGGFETTPMSTTYDILAAGCLPLDPGPPKRPKFPPIPKVKV